MRLVLIRDMKLNTEESLSLTFFVPPIVDRRSTPCDWHGSTFSCADCTDHGTNLAADRCQIESCLLARPYSQCVNDLDSRVL
jgi:hypothetical protein